MLKDRFSHGTAQIMMVLCFMYVSTNFQSYREDGSVKMKGSVQQSTRSTVMSCVLPPAV